jgi:hypothetical protein
MQSKSAVSSQIWGRIHAHAWADADFKDRLETDPTATVRQFLVHQLGWSEAEANHARILKVGTRPDDLSDSQLQSAASGQSPIHIVADNSC